MRGRATPALAMIAMAAATIGAAPPRQDQPVLVGGTEDLDACPSNAQVTGLNPRGDNFLTVRGRPALAGRELDRIGPALMVWACDETRDGGWTGIVYSPPGKDVDCGVGTPIKQRSPYRGPCRSGWVSSRFLVIVAG